VGYCCISIIWDLFFFSFFTLCWFEIVLFAVVNLRSHIALLCLSVSCQMLSLSQVLLQTFSRLYDTCSVLGLHDFGTNIYWWFFRHFHFVGRRVRLAVSAASAVMWLLYRTLVGKWDQRLQSKFWIYNSRFPLSPQGAGTWVAQSPATPLEIGRGAWCRSGPRGDPRTC